MRAKIDKFLSSWVSKKLLVFIVATGLASSGKLVGSEWANVAMVYIGTQGTIDLFMRLRSNDQ